MKKWMIVPVFLLAISGLLFIACPSEPESAPERLKGDDLIRVDASGVIKYEFNDITVEEGKTYEVIIDVEDIDYELQGCHFQAQLLYTLNGVDYLLAGSQNALPTVIADFGKKYRASLTAGAYIGEENEATTAKQEKGKYKIPIPATTPAGATQFLRITVKTPNWYVMGLPWSEQEVKEENAKDNWDVDYYGGGAELASFKGEITVRVKPKFSYIPGDIVTVANAETNMKGNIEDEEFQKLLDAPENAVLRVSCSAKIGVGSAGGTQAEPGWAIAEFGVPSEYKIRGQNISTPVLIPRFWNGATIDNTPNPAFEFYADILISDILADAFADGDTSLVFFNVYNGATATKLQIYTAVSSDLPPEVQEMLDWYEKLKGVDPAKLKELADLLDQIKGLLP
jgi:hypothetical protein